MIIGTLINTWLNGELVGSDVFANRYYRNSGSLLNGRERRWVIYKSKADASSVPAEWHAWLHHTTDTPLTESAAQLQPWQKEHQPNQTGSSGAYRPAGHDLRGGHRAHATGDYQAWTPGDGQ
ncbi:MAG: NADH:ubiquinone oxidoreductase subunit NDUFA12 [Rhodospirillaceae bacterium]|nr:NADH:ubiquinone oxidoreductase subunit NDUFA12 [Rhodospirillaceae bacterium]